MKSICPPYAVGDEVDDHRHVQDVVAAQRAQLRRSARLQEDEERHAGLGSRREPAPLPEDGAHGAVVRGCAAAGARSCRPKISSSKK